MHSAETDIMEKLHRQVILARSNEMLHAYRQFPFLLQFQDGKNVR